MGGFTQVMFSLFAASTVIIFVYALLCLFSVGMSLAVIFRGRREFSKGHMRRFVNALSITLAVSFLYAVWNILIRLELVVIGNEIVATMVDNIILVLFIMLLTYVAYLARDISKKFGFNTAGKKIGEIAKKKYGKRTK